MQIRVVHVVLQVTVRAVAMILDLFAEPDAFPRGLRTAARVALLAGAFWAATRRVSARDSVPHQHSVGRDLGAGRGGAGRRERRRGSLQDREDGGRQRRRSEERLLGVDLDAVGAGGRGGCGGAAAGAAVERVGLRTVLFQMKI